MIDKYVDSHTIIICGDMNGSLSNERNNSHDAKLKSCQKPINFLSSWRKVKISNRLHHFKWRCNRIYQDHLNSSTHIPVKAKLSSRMATMKIKTRPSCTAYKLLWDKTDRQEYKNTFNCILTQNMDNWEEDTIDQKLDYLTRVMWGMGLCYLMPLLTIFQVYRGGRFYWWSKLE